MQSKKVLVGLILCAHVCATASSGGTQQPPALAPGFVQGEVVSYAHVPIKYWSLEEGKGVLPYLWEYGLQAWDSRKPLEYYHEENIRRIDMVSQWSTAVTLYPRYNEFVPEAINLMIRCFRNRQLIVLGSRVIKPSEDPGPYTREQAILGMLWSNRDNVLTNPEGDRVTGQQLINNILAIKIRDEAECGDKTAGMQEKFAEFNSYVRYWERDGQTPFTHIRPWYNMLAYHAGCYAACQSDIDDHNRVKLPTNTSFIGVDCYHYWFHQYSPFDPADPHVSSSQIRAHSDLWQSIRTTYYPSEVDVHHSNVNDPQNWTPECYSDTHGLMNGIQLAQANEAMMFYIACSSNISGQTYTTPIETMDAYYDHIRPGPWVGLSWWIFGEPAYVTQSTIAYVDKLLVHYTPQHPEGVPYTESQLNSFRDRFVASRKRMYNDVVYNQFLSLNEKPVIQQISPDPDVAYTGRQYTKQLNLVGGYPAPEWSIALGPAGLQINTEGLVTWIPAPADGGSSATAAVRASNSKGFHVLPWQINVKRVGDLEDDGDVDLFDVLRLVNILLGRPPDRTPHELRAGDLDGDGDNDLFDILALVDVLLGRS